MVTDRTGGFASTLQSKYTSSPSLILARSSEVPSLMRTLNIKLWKQNQLTQAANVITLILMYHRKTVFLHIKVINLNIFSLTLKQLSDDFDCAIFNESTHVKWRVSRLHFEKNILIQYWPIYYWFFWKKIKYLKNWMTHHKKFSVMGRGTNVDSNGKCLNEYQFLIF